MDSYKVGEELEREGTKWLCVRLVERDTALVVNEAGETFITTESYAMLKNEKGELDFVVLLHEDLLVLVKASQIHPLASLWRKHNV